MAEVDQLSRMAIMRQANQHQAQTNRSYALSAATMLVAASEPAEVGQIFRDTTDFEGVGMITVAHLEQLANYLLAYIETGKFPHDHNDAR